MSHLAEECSPASPADGFELHRTECVCFPRSGHHLLHRLLEAYFGAERLRYCEPYGDASGRLDVDDRTNFQKNHDLELDTPIRTDRRYLVQIRYPIESITSWFAVASEDGAASDTPEGWTSFAIQHAAFWMRFYRKWVLDHVPQRLVLSYAELVDDPVTQLARAAAFLGDPEPDRDRLAMLSAREGVARRSHPMSFKYYGPGFFSMLGGLFAAVPGIDVESGTLVLPAALGDREATLSAAVQELREAGVRLQRAMAHLNR